MSDRISILQVAERRVEQGASSREVAKALIEISRESLIVTARLIDAHGESKEHRAIMHLLMEFDNPSLPGGPY